MQYEPPEMEEVMGYLGGEHGHWGRGKAEPRGHGRQALSRASSRDWSDVQSVQPLHGHRPRTGQTPGIGVQLQQVLPPCSSWPVQSGVCESKGKWTLNSGYLEPKGPGPGSPSGHVSRGGRFCEAAGRLGQVELRERGPRDRMEGGRTKPCLSWGDHRASKEE